MNPVRVSTMLAMASPAPSAAIQGAPFTDFLNESVANADDQMPQAADATNSTAAGLVPASCGSTPEAATPGSPTGALMWAMPVGASIDAHARDVSQSMGAAKPAEPISPATSAVTPPTQAKAFNGEDLEPSAEDEAKARTASPEPAPILSPPVPAPAPVTLALAAGGPPAILTRKTSAEFSLSSVGIDVQPAHRMRLANSAVAVAIQKEAKAKISQPLPSLILEPVSEPASFEARLGIGAAPANAATLSLPVATPVAELRQLALTQDHEWIGALSREIVSNAGRDNQLQFTLMPETLGQLDVALTTDNGQVNIRLETSTAAAAQIISADQARLIEDLRQSGLKLGQFEMSNRQNGNGQHRPTAPERQYTESIPNATQPTAHRRARGRFA